MRKEGGIFDPEEGRERSEEGLAPGRLGPLAPERESVILRRRRWPERAAGASLLLAFLAWSWWNFISPRFDRLPSEQEGTTPRPERASPYLHEDTNLVKLIQSRLRGLGYAVGPIDGVIGPKTMAAIEQFQMKHGLPATGLLDPATKASIEGLPLPKQETPRYMIARVKEYQEDGGKRLQVDLSVDPASDEKAAEGYVRSVLSEYARSHPQVKVIQVRAYLGIATMAAGAYAVANWVRPEGKPPADAGKGVKIDFQEWARKAEPGVPQLPPPER